MNIMFSESPILKCVKYLNITNMKGRNFLLSI